MTEVLTGGVALVLFVLVLLFIGFWFGWTTVLWVLAATVVISVVMSLFARTKA